MHSWRYKTMIYKTISYYGEEIARIIKAHHIDNLEFFTEEDKFLQVGLHNKSADWHIRAHSHSMTPNVVDRAEEVFYIIKGQVEVSLIDQTSKELIEKVMLYTGDTMITYGQAHSLHFIKPTQLFEVKQGPFQKNLKTFVDK